MPCYWVWATWASDFQSQQHVWTMKANVLAGHHWAAHTSTLFPPLSQLWILQSSFLSSLAALFLYVLEVVSSKQSGKRNLNTAQSILASNFTITSAICGLLLGQSMETMVPWTPPPHIPPLSSFLQELHQYLPQEDPSASHFSYSSTLASLGTSQRSISASFATNQLVDGEVGGRQLQILFTSLILPNQKIPASKIQTMLFKKAMLIWTTTLSSTTSFSGIWHSFPLSKEML